MRDNGLDRLLQSKKYRDICPDTVRRVWSDCEKRYRKPRDVDRAARESLHGITGAFLTPAEAAACADILRNWAQSGQTDALLERALRMHASTRERLPLDAMDALYRRIFEITGPPNRILDLACGVNPLYLGARGIATVGMDISGQAVRLINAFGEGGFAPVSAVCADLLCDGAVPRERFDIALLFKTLPLLERQRAGAAAEVMGAVNAAWIVVSFPTRTLGGRNVGMAKQYAGWMERHLPANRAVEDHFETDNELIYILRESGDETVSAPSPVL